MKLTPASESGAESKVAFRADAARRWTQLTLTQQRIAVLSAERQTQEQISQRLGLAPDTITKYMKEAADKLEPGTADPPKMVLVLAYAALCAASTAGVDPFKAGK